VGQGHSLASLSLASDKRGGGSSDGVCGELTGRRSSPPPHVMRLVQSRCCPGGTATGRWKVRGLLDIRGVPCV
jgi:hypothetical protein